MQPLHFVPCSHTQLLHALNVAANMMSEMYLLGGLSSHASSGRSRFSVEQVFQRQRSQHRERACLGLQAFLQQRRAEMVSPSFEALASGLPSAYRDTTVEQVKTMLSAVKVGALA